MKKILLGLTLSFAAVSSFADTEMQSLENISQELVNIRQEIETLHGEINFEKESYRDQMRSYSTQKSDLSARVGRAELNIKDLEREIATLAEQNKEKSKAEQNITPLLIPAIQNLRSTVSKSLPFKLSQRLDALNDIEHRLITNTISPNKAANQLWAFVEDELILGKSNGIYNDTLNINGQDKLVKVLRIGKIAMFYKTNEGEYGVTKKVDGEWKQSAILGKEDVSQLEMLFDSFNKNIRNGQFTVPNFLPRS